MIGALPRIANANRSVAGDEALERDARSRECRDRFDKIAMTFARFDSPNHQEAGASMEFFENRPGFLGQALG